MTNQTKTCSQIASFAIFLPGWLHPGLFFLKFLANFLKFLQIFSNFLSNSPFSPSPAGRLGQLKPPWYQNKLSKYILRIKVQALTTQMQTEMHKFNLIQIQLQNRNQYKITKYVARLAERVEGGIKENWSGRQPDDLGLPLHCQGLSSSSSHNIQQLYVCSSTPFPDVPHAPGDPGEVVSSPHRPLSPSPQCGWPSPCRGEDTRFSLTCCRW